MTRWSAVALALLGACVIDFEKYDPRLGGSDEGGGGADGGAAGAGAAMTGGGGAGGNGGDGGNGGGGNGGGAACGIAELAADDFEDGVFAPDWYVGAGNGANHDENGGVRIITLPVNGDASWSGSSSIRLYDMRSQRAFIEVPQMANTATTANAFLHVVYDSENFVTVGQRSGELLIAQYIADTWLQLTSVPWDPIAHRWWQLRESGGMLSWETSPDGQSWTTHATRAVAALFPMDLVQIEYGASTEGGETQPGEVHFDNLQGGSSTAPWCPLALLSDDFDDNATSRMWSWASYDGGGCQHAEVGGRLVFDLDGTGPIDCAYVSSQRFDARAAALTAEVPAVSMQTSAYAFVRLEIDSANGLEVVLSNGQLLSRTEVAASTTVIDAVAYDASDHRWWRIEDDAGTARFWTSPDGSNWTPRGGTPATIDMRAVTVVIGAGIDSPQPSSGTTEVDNLNLAP